MRMFALQVLVCLFVIAPTLAAEKPTPPGQPKHGPGGADYKHAKVVRHVYGAGVDQFWIFEPAEPTPASAPVVVFNHGWIAMSPSVYLGWVHHLVRRGHIVIYPRYQDTAWTMPWTFTPNAIKAVKRALEQLKQPGHVRPELDKFALVGHSAGGAISANMAATAAKEGLPKAKAVMIVMPGRGMKARNTPFFPPADYKQIPADTLLLVLAGDVDRIVGDVTAKEIFRGTPQIPADRKDYIVVRSDHHGSPPLVADHISPCCPYRPGPIITGRRINAIDTYAFWKLFDGLTDAAFHGRNREYALGNTPQQRFMGAWSDGTPVKELVVTDEP